MNLLLENASGFVERKRMQLSNGVLHAEGENSTIDIANIPRFNVLPWSRFFKTNEQIEASTVVRFVIIDIHAIMVQIVGWVILDLHVPL